MKLSRRHILFSFAYLCATIDTDALTPASRSISPSRVFAVQSGNLNGFSAQATGARNNVVLFAAKDTDEDTVCGSGFKLETGPDGKSPRCVFDYEAAASAFGTGDEVADEHYWDALESQNKARKNFGLKPLTPEQYVALQAQNHQIGKQQIVDATAKIFSEFDTNGDGVITVQELKAGLEKSLNTELSQEHIEKVMEHFDASGDGLLQPDEMVSLDQFRTKLNAVAGEDKLDSADGEEQESMASGIFQSFLNLFQDTCESNFDCERPEVCCDFGYKKMCCSTGKMAKDLQLEYAHVTVPLGMPQ